jgi:hypothetical protein
MPIDKKTALDQIDAALSAYQDVVSKIRQPVYRTTAEANQAIASAFTRMKAAIDRLAPADSVYRDSGKNDVANTAGSLQALRADYEAGYLETYRELIHGETFSDFLDMALHLLSDAYKDHAAVVAAATLAGGVLEQHLRALCVKFGISPIPENLNPLNTALYKKAYQSNDMKQITAWTDIRNAAAHGEHAKVIRGQVELMIPGIRQFISANPA